MLIGYLYKKKKNNLSLMVGHSVKVLAISHWWDMLFSVQYKCQVQ